MARITFPLGLFGLQDVQPFVFEEEQSQVNLDRPVGTRDNPQRSLLGGFVFDNIRFQPGNYTDRDGQRRSYGGLTLETVLMRVNQRKEIVMTKVAGRPGSVKEYISEGDYEVQIYGTLQRDVNEYPADEIERLIEICQVPVAIEVTSPFLNQFGIDLLVIDSYSFNQKQAYENQQPFELAALSDRPVELVLDAEQI